MKWLVTAFEPFAGARTNSSLLALETLRARDFGGQVEFFAPVPTEFARSWPTVHGACGGGLRGVLGLGQAATRSRLGLERVAVNWIDTGIADNSGFVASQGPVLAGEPLALWSPIPWERLGDAPEWERSYSAGTFVCNALMFHLLRWARSNGRMAGFIHVPALQSQTESAFAGQVRLEDERVADALERVLRFLIGLGE